MTDFPYKEGSDLRIRFDSDTALWHLEQLRIRTANGATDPHTVAGILDLDEDGWEVLSTDQRLTSTVLQAIKTMLAEGSRMREVNLDPYVSTSPGVQQAVGVLATLQ